MLAIGYTSDGKRIEFDCSNGLYCYNSDLVSLDIPEGVTKVMCWGNLLTELIIPDSVEVILCDKKVSGLDELIGKVDIELW